MPKIPATRWTCEVAFGITRRNNKGQFNPGFALASTSGVFMMLTARGQPDPKITTLWQSKGGRFFGSRAYENRQPVAAEGWQYQLGRAAGKWQRVRARLRWQYLMGYAAGLYGRFTGR